MNIDDILNNFYSYKLENTFNSCVKELINEKEEDFLLNNFINFIPKRILNRISFLDPSDVFKESSKEYSSIQTFINNNFDEIFNRFFNKLNIDFNGDKKELFNKLNIDLNELIDYVYSFLDNRWNIIDKLIEDNDILNNVIDIDKISTLEDKIGDTNSISKRIDFNNRDNAFIDIDGEILISNKNQTHGQMIQEYINTSKSSSFRPSINTMDEFSNNYYAFGHILDGNIFIETYTLDSTSIDRIISDIESSGINYEKIYEYNAHNCEISRIAKVIK